MTASVCLVFVSSSSYGWSASSDTKRGVCLCFVVTERCSASEFDQILLGATCCRRGSTKDERQRETMLLQEDSCSEGLWDMLALPRAKFTYSADLVRHVVCTRER